MWSTKSIGSFIKKRKEINAICSQRLADQEIGYAAGICQALTIIGFKHGRMKELSEFL